MRILRCASLVAGLLLLAGCDKSADSVTAPPAIQPSSVPTSAQAKLPTVKLWVGAQEIIAEVAGTPRQREIGMMFRTNILENEGMLFLFPYSTQMSFWMTNVPIPLTCAYMDRQGTILEIYDMKPNDPTPIVSKSSDLQFVLETKQGWFGRNNVATGMAVRTEHGSIAETFLRRQ
jgi:uncharacterized membrane protein (UPF0127 family)